MSRDRSGILRPRPLDILVRPKISQPSFAVNANIRPAQAHFRLVLCAVEKRYCQRAASKRPGPDLLIAGFPDSLALLSIFVLIDGDDFAVGKNRQNLRT